MFCANSHKTGPAPSVGLTLKLAINDMEPEIYIKEIAIGLGIWLLAALPLTIGIMVALVSGNKIKNKPLFVISSGVVSYGIGALVFVAFIPFTMIAYYFAPYWYDQGYDTLANSVSYISEGRDIVPIIVAIISSFVVPIIGRMKYWSKLCECMSNK